MKKVALVFALICAFWIIGDIWIIDKTDALQHEYREKKDFYNRYDFLKKQFSKSAQKKAEKHFETLLRLYRIKPDIQKNRNHKIYSFTLDTSNTDIVLNKLLNSDLVIDSLSLKRKDSQHLNIKLGVGL